MLFPEENAKINKHIQGMQFFSFSNAVINMPALIGNQQNDVINFEKDYWIAITRITGFVNLNLFDFQYQIFVNGSDRSIFEAPVFANAYFKTHALYQTGPIQGQYLEKRLQIPFVISPRANLSFQFTQQVASIYTIRLVYDGVRFETMEQLNAIFKYNSNDE